MQLDHTRIAVRERNLSDILDLSLHVFRRFAVPLLLTFGLGAAPLMLINYLLIGWLVDIGERTDFYYLDEGSSIARYVWLLSLLTMIEAPLASIFATAYLGQAVFVDRPRLRAVIGDVFRMAGRVAWCQFLVRGVLPAWLLLLTLERYGEFSAEVEGFLLPMLAFYAFMLRAFRPYVNEIVLLERSPLFTRDPRLISIGRRSAQLHNPSASDLMGRGLATAVLAAAMSVALFSSMLFVTGIFLNRWSPGPSMFLYGLPIAMWLAAAYLTVARFLSYLDLRIRQEGWEVELRMRAEAQRMTARSGLWGILALVMLGLPTTAAAQVLSDQQADEVVEQELRRLPWYDRETQDLERIDVQPPPELKNRLSRWESREKKATKPWNVPMWVWSVLEVLGWTVLIVLLCAVIYYLIRTFVQYEMRVGGLATGASLDDLEGDIDRIEALPFQLARPRTDLLEEARRHYEAGRFDEAMTYLYSYQLVELDKHHVIRLSRGKTNRQYLREVRRAGGPVALMEESVVAFEDVFFGRHALGRKRFESCWNRLEEFRQALPSEAVVG